MNEKHISFIDKSTASWIMIVKAEAVVGVEDRAEEDRSSSQQLRGSTSPLAASCSEEASCSVVRHDFAL
ncbi:unnamed protein product [Nezara viridula]|uniref:Uncharacterized protein n=1 Tax=Nezara viridula TaxID=85310 RepID=A0A9P0HKA2_NEZVI|nr:unnamed protein product [Nezara viridula]